MPCSRDGVLAYVVPHMQVAMLAGRQGKLSKSIANAGAKSVSRMNKIIQRTSKAVKVRTSSHLHHPLAMHADARFDIRFNCGNFVAGFKILYILDNH